MRRRLTGIGVRAGARQAPPPEDETSGDRQASLVWMQTWGEHEEHRVAQWLTARCRAGADGDVEAGPGGVSPAPGPLAVAPAPAVTGPTARSAERDADDRPAPAGHSRGFLEAEIEALEDARRRLAEALAVERRKAERERRERLLVRSDLEAEITGLEEQRRRALLAAEAATLAADRAVAEHHAAVAELELTRLEARRREAEHFEVWCALDAEVSALKARRRRLRALRRR